MRRGGTATGLMAAVVLAAVLAGCAPSPTDDCAPLVAADADGDGADPTTWVEEVHGSMSILVPPVDPTQVGARGPLDLRGAYGDHREYLLAEASASADPTLEVAFVGDGSCVVEQRDLGGGLAATALWVHRSGSILSAPSSQAIVALTRPGTDEVLPVTLGEGDGAVAVRLSFYVPFSGDDADEQAIAYLQSEDADVLLDVLETLEIAP